MNHSLLSADRATHLKIVLVALIGAVLVVAVGITARETVGSAASASGSVVVKAGKPALYTRTETAAIR